MDHAALLLSSEAGSGWGEWGGVGVVQPKGFSSKLLRLISALLARIALTAACCPLPAVTLTVWVSKCG